MTNWSHLEDIWIPIPKTIAIIITILKFVSIIFFLCHASTWMHFVFKSKICIRVQKCYLIPQWLDLQNRSYFCFGSFKPQMKTYLTINRSWHQTFILLIEVGFKIVIFIVKITILRAVKQHFWILMQICDFFFPWKFLITKIFHPKFI